MKNLFYAALAAQSIFVILFLVHQFTYYSLGSTFLNIVYILSFFVGGYLLWQSFKNPEIMGFLKISGIILGFIPIIGLIIFVLILSLIRC